MQNFMLLLVCYKSNVTGNFTDGNLHSNTCYVSADSLQGKPRRTKCYPEILVKLRAVDLKV